MLTVILVMMLQLQGPLGGLSVRSAETVDEHLVLCHQDFLRFWRIETTTVDQELRVSKSWTHWILINDKSPEDKRTFEEDRAFYMRSKIRVQYAALEGKLPE